MGWDFKINPCTKQEIVDECLRSVALEWIDQALRGNELWVVWENKTNKHRHISIFLLASKKGCWGYKEISESEGPLYYKCPLSFFALAPVANQGWRDKVVAYHSRKLKNRKDVIQIQPGKIVALDVISNEFRVTYMKPFQGVNLANGKLYRLVKARVVNIRDEEP